MVSVERSMRIKLECLDQYVQAFASSIRGSARDGSAVAEVLWADKYCLQWSIMYGGTCRSSTSLVWCSTEPR